MWAHIKEQYERVSKPLALCFLLLVGVGGVVDNRSLQLAASIALLSLSLILQLLFEIHARVTTSDGARFFESFASAVPQMTSSIERRLHRGQSVRLRWVGVTHEAGWPAVQAVTKLVVDETVPRSASLRAELFIIDPDGDVCARTDGPNVAQIRATIGTIAHFVSDHDASLATHKSSIDVYKYDHRPTWHGLLIDEDILYWSVCMPSNLKLSAPQGGAEVVRASDGIASRHRIEHFISWTDELTRAASLPTLRVIAGGNDPMPARMAPAADLTIVPDAALPDDAISSSVAPAADLHDRARRFASRLRNRGLIRITELAAAMNRARRMRQRFPVPPDHGGAARGLVMFATLPVHPGSRPIRCSAGGDPFTEQRHRGE